MRSRVAMLLVLSFVAFAPLASAQLIAPDQPVAGQSQRSLAGQWIRWLIEQPVATNPLLDVTGAHAGRGDQGSVFFLASAPGNDPIRRTITVPAGEPLFAPIFSYSNDNTLPAGQPPTNYSAAELVNALDPYLDPKSIDRMFVQIDNAFQRNVFDHRQTTDPADPFSYTTTSRDNFIDGVQGNDSTLGTGVFPSTVFPVVEDGYWIALQPFAPGSTHTLRFGGSGTYLGVQDVTYVITTTPEPATSGLLFGPLMIALAKRRRRA